MLGVPEPKDTVEEGIDTSPIVLADKKDTKSANDLARDFLELLKKITATNEELCLVIDGLDKIKSGKVGRPGFWIPKDTSGNVSLIVSTTTGDNRTIEELCDAHSFPA